MAVANPGFRAVATSPVGLAALAMGFALGGHVPSGNSNVVLAALAQDDDAGPQPAAFWAAMVALAAVEGYLCALLAGRLWNGNANAGGRRVAPVVLAGVAVGLAVETLTAFAFT